MTKIDRSYNKLIDHSIKKFYNYLKTVVKLYFHFTKGLTSEPEKKGAVMKRRTQIGDIRREELTKAALNCLATKGYDRVTLDDVTREAGLSKGIASYYFKNREELLVSVIHKMWDNVLELTRNIWEIPEEVDDEELVYTRISEFYSDPKVDIVRLIQGGIRFLVAWFGENVHIVKVILEFWCQVPRNPMITDLNKSMHNFLVRISSIVLQEGMKRGTLKKRDPRLAAYILISAITGLAFNVIINEGNFDSKKLEKDFGDLVFDYLTP